MRQFTPSTEVDFVVIGSGAAGGIMAKQLSVAGFSVVVLEQGGWGKYGHEQDYTKDEWLNDNPSDEDRLMTDPVKQPNTFRRNDKDKTVRGSHSYGCVVGGGTVTYGGSSWRHLPYEFREVSHDKTIPSGTGMADWPITYEELEPYYVQAEWEMGISGQRVNSPLFAPMSKDYPVPPLPLKSSGALFEVAAKKLGLTSVPSPMAIISQPYMGRAACVHCGMCSGFGCHVRARSSSAVTMIPIAEKTGRCEIRAQSYVREISTDASGRVTGVIYFDSQKREVQQRAKAVVLSANASESARPRVPHRFRNWGAAARKSSLGGGVQEGAARRSQPQDDDHVVRDAAAARDQSRRSRPGGQGRLGAAGHAHHVPEPSRRHQEHGVLPAEVD
jgi:choline dehydrogenase-like flavoprotein